MKTFSGLTGYTYETVDKPVSKAGDGHEYELIGHPDKLAKIYNLHSRNTSLEEKLLAMLKLQSRAAKYCLWPIDALYENGKFAGSIRPKFTGMERLRKYYANKNRKNYPWTLYIVIAKNLSLAVHYVHESGQLIGGLSHDNILIDPKTGSVVLTDVEQFHIVDGSGVVHRCVGGIPEYIAPELNGVDFASSPLPTFTMQTDLFSLSVLVFSLLMNGAHPFTSRENLLSGVCAYFPKCSDSSIKISNYSPELDSLPGEFYTLFSRAFVSGYSDPSLRPSAEEYFYALEHLEKSIQNCSENFQHQYYLKAVECPWCKIEGQKRPDFEAGVISASLMQHDRPETDSYSMPVSHPAQLDPYSKQLEQPTEPGPSLRRFEQPIEPNPSLNRFEQPIEPDPSLNRFEQAIEPDPRLKRFEQPIEPNPGLNRFEQPIEPDPSLKRFEQPVEPDPRLKRFEQPIEPDPRLKRFEQSIEPDPRSMMYEQPVEFDPRLTMHEQPAELDPRQTMHEQPVELGPNQTMFEQPVELDRQTMYEQPVELDSHLKMPVQHSHSEMFEQLADITHQMPHAGRAEHTPHPMPFDQYQEAHMPRYADEKTSERSYRPVEHPMIENKKLSIALIALITILVLGGTVLISLALLRGGSVDNGGDDTDENYSAVISEETEQFPATEPIPSEDPSSANDSTPDEGALTTHAPETDQEQLTSPDPDTENSPDALTSGSQVYLVDLDFVNASSEQGGFWHYSFVQDNHGNTYDNGLGGIDALLDNFQDYAINGNFSTISGTVVLNFDFRLMINFETVMRIYGDGELLYESPLITAGVGPSPFSVDINGVNMLRVSIHGQHMIRIVDCILY